MSEGIIYTAFGMFVLYIISRIAVKAGYSWTWCFLMWIPIVNLFMATIFAFVKWPIEKELFIYRFGDYWQRIQNDKLSDQFVELKDQYSFIKNKIHFGEKGWLLDSAMEPEVFSRRVGALYEKYGSEKEA